ncbi:MAG: DUF2059 domain-containing protein [Methylocystis sp.]|jgi:hypothetical protein|nr:DUF2059 domain-containing protein [Methylocystis sp.]MCA3584255.1 DUF2059 domain-containing protein [Methylocystis sp.]MCA3589135.1 DUF2059 domain-containing protein [Methylocystis sp.]MCA3591420.1 DUF2059 domain-containing protein [Methylocystis sp.]
MTRFCQMMLFSAVLLAANPVLAQQPPAAPPSPPAAEAAPISESHLAAAREVVVSSGLASSFENIVPQIADQIRAGFSRTRPEIIKDMEVALRPIITDLTKQTEPMILASSRVYAQRIPEPELKEIAAFFKSPAGQKYIILQGQISNELAITMEVFSQTLGNMMMDQLREDLRKKNIQL